MISLVPPIVLDFLKEAVPHALAELQRRHLEAAREIIVRRLQRGKLWAISDDDAAAALWTYLRAAQEGAARRNLEMMAEALATAAAEPSFYPNEFRRQASVLADLSREEVYVLAAFIRAKRGFPGGGEDGAAKAGEWQAVCTDLLRQPALFPDGYAVEAHTAGLLRTGLVLPWSGLDAFTGFSSTPRLIALARLVDFQLAAEASEGTAPASSPEPASAGRPAPA
jgi:hypothetical protein